MVYITTHYSLPLKTKSNEIHKSFISQIYCLFVEKHLMLLLVSLPIFYHWRRKNLYKSSEKTNKIKGLMVFIKHLLKDFKGENVMEKQGISRFLPYEADYQTLSYCRNWTGKMLWLVAGLSVILPLISYLDISVGYKMCIRDSPCATRNFAHIFVVSSR